MRNKILLISAESVGGYNDTFVYNAKIKLNGIEENILIERHYQDLKEPHYLWEIHTELNLTDEDKEEIINTISKDPPSIYSDAEPKLYEEMDSVEEIITNISSIDNNGSYTIARVMENDKCVELHYNNGKVTLEYGVKLSKDYWESEINDNVNWFNFELTDEKILDYLNKEFDNYFLENDYEYEY